MAITIRHIADRVGLSVQTVANVLGRSPHLYSAATRKKVDEAVRELGYLPNSMARAVRSGKFGAVALLLSTNPHRSTVPPELLEGVHDALAQHDLHLIVARLPDATLTSEGFVPKVLRELSSDGLLLNYTDHIPEIMVKRISDHVIPSVWLNTDMDRDAICPNDLGAAERATRWLIAKGHRHIAYVQLIDWGNHYSTTDRLKGYKNAMRAAGLEPKVWGDISAGYPGMASRVFLAGAFNNNRISAVVAYSPEEACLSIRAAEHLKVTPHFQCITFNHEPVADAGAPIATMLIPTRQVGIKACELLLKKMKSPSRAKRSLRIEFEFFDPDSAPSVVRNVK